LECKNKNYPAELADLRRKKICDVLRDLREKLFQRPHRTRLLALLAENALGGVLPLARVVVDLHLHRTDFQTLVAMDALLLVTLDAQQ